MSEEFEIGPLAKRQRGVGVGTFLVWVILAAAVGAIAWEVFRTEARLKVGMTEQLAPSATNVDITALNTLVKELRSAEQNTSNDVKTALQLLTSEQAATKSLIDTLAALQSKIDALQRPTPPVAAKKPIVTTRKPPAAKKPPLADGEPDQLLEPAPGAPSAVPR